jgi:hypothetical protein
LILGGGGGGAAPKPEKRGEILGRRQSRRPKIKKNELKQMLLSGLGYLSVKHYLLNFKLFKKQL